MCAKIVIPFSHIIGVIIGHSMPERALKQGEFPVLLRIKIEILGTPTGSYTDKNEESMVGNTGR